MTNGRRIRDWRQRAGLRQEDVADSLGISQATISALERDDIALTVDRARRIADLCGVSPSEWGALRDLAQDEPAA